MWLDEIKEKFIIRGHDVYIYFANYFHMSVSVYLNREKTKIV